MFCKNHPNEEAVDRCTGCAEAFCDNCLVEINGQKYCGDCKVMAVDGERMAETATRPCKEAGSALTMAIIGLICFGIILGPMAIAKANKAKQMIAKNPRLTGSGKATAATIIGILDIVFFVLGLIIRFSSM